MGTDIPYAEYSYNITGGCNKCRTGCQNCWAVNSVHRLAHNPLQGNKWKGLVAPDGKNWTGKIKLFPEMFTKEGSPAYSPLNRKKPTRYFVNTKSDLFHKDVPFEYIGKGFEVMCKYQQHTFLVFTKRVKRLFDFYKTYGGTKYLEKALHETGQETPIPNIQLIVSISTQKDADEMIPILLKIPAAVLGVSIEPMLEEINLTGLKPSLKTTLNALDGWQRNYVTRAKREQRNASQYTNGIKWIVIGCESGPKRRPCKLELIRSIVDQGKAANVLVYVKQMEINGKVSHNPDEWPEWARTRELM